MSEYIKRDDAIHALLSPSITSDAVAIMNIAAALNRIPVADVRENKHGKWVFERNYVDKDSDEFVDCYVCSLCGAPHNEEYPFCPNCGSMNGGGKDGT